MQLSTMYIVLNINSIKYYVLYIILNINAVKYHVVESLQSHMILTMSHWSSGLTCLLPATRDPGSNPLGGLM